MKPYTRLLHAPLLSIAALSHTGTATATDVAVCTDLGNFTIELFDNQSPLHVENFLAYVDRAYYTGTVFHRVIDGFVVQGGGYTREYRSKLLMDPVMNESRNGLGNNRGTIAAARTGDPHSATSQFYVNLADNTPLNASGENWGYTVFGQVIEGMEVLDAIAALPTGAGGPFPTDVTDPLVATTSMARIGGNSYPDLSLAGRREALRADIENAVSLGNNDEAATLFREYRSVCGDFDANLLFAEAETLAALDQNAAAVESLSEYLRVADNTSEEYLEALSLSRELDPGAADALAAVELRLSELAEAGGCVVPEMPVVPDAEETTMEQMVATQGAVQTYIEESNDLLECLEEIAEDDDLSDDDRDIARDAYNREVGDQETIAERWNVQRARFIELQQQ